MPRVYSSLTQQDYAYFSDQYDVRYDQDEIKKGFCSLSKNDLKLDHSFTPIQSMNDFCAQSWQKLTYLNLVQCRIDQNMLNEFFSYAKHFP